MWPALIPLLGTVLDKIFPDQTKAAEAKVKLIELAQQGELAALNADLEVLKGQLDVNKEEAKSNNMFVAGWRPFFGWIGGLGFAYMVILQPLLPWLFTVILNKSLPALPTVDLEVLMTIITGMLGIGGFRTYEKVKGVTK